MGKNPKKLFQLGRQMNENAHGQTEYGKGWGVFQGADPSESDKQWDAGQKGSERRTTGQSEDKDMLRLYGREKRLCAAFLMDTNGLCQRSWDLKQESDASEISSAKVYNRQ